MRKYHIIFGVILHAIIIVGQTKETQSYLPNYTPPSPTVAALMKFEEVPVDNYTGIPDVSIPIFNSVTKDKNVPVDISLKYHPTSVAVNEIASDVGLGWSLFAGGTIARTVKDLPDEMLVYQKKVGIYHTSVSGSKNNYYNIIDILNQGIQNPSEQYIVDEFLWEANEKKKYDTQHDLWQFNFMGHSGRFYIKKNMTTGILEVVPLDNYNLKIINHYNTTNNNYPSNPIYSPVSFDIIDTYGYKYVFEEYEETAVIPFSYSQYYPAAAQSNFADPLTTRSYKSAFHLTKILTMNDKVLVELQYSNEFNENNFVNKGEIINRPIFDPHPMWASFELVDPCNLCPNGGEAAIKSLEPSSTTFSTQNNVNVRKIKDILIDGVAKIHFKFQKGRFDTCYYNDQKGCKLTEISVNKWDDTPSRKYEFKYNYRNLINNRLFLQEIDFKDSDSTNVYNYKFEYEDNITYDKNVGRDFWGFYNLTSACDIGTKSKNVTPSFCTSQVLQKIKLPTGGCQIFNYEPNDFSYIGNEPVTNFDENINNWNTETDYQTFTINSSYGHPEYHSLGIFSTPTIFVFNSTIYNNQGLAGFLKLYKKDPLHPNNPPQQVTYLHECPDELTLESGYEYLVGFTWYREAQAGADTLPVEYLPIIGTAYIGIDKKTKISDYKSLIYGGGIRINRIGYFEKDVNKDFYKWYENYSQYDIPLREKNYTYRLKGYPLKSSGGLVFPKPIYNYYKEVKTCIDCGGYPGNQELEYTTETSYNNLLINKTRGSDIGYKNVTVFETGNGRTEFEYTTSIDNPELGIEYSSIPPFLPIESYDFKRGLLLSKEEFDNTGRNLSKVTNEYEVEQYSQNTGFNVFNRTENSFSNSYRFSNFDVFTTYKTVCNDSNNVNFNCFFGTTVFGDPITPNPSFPICPCRCYHGESVPEVIFQVPQIENYGWVKLLHSKNENYFYDSSSTQHVVEKNEYYEYNTLNRNVATKTESMSQGGDLITKYFYPKDPQMINEPHKTDLINKNIIETPLSTQVFRGLEKLSEQKTIYNDWGNLLLPESIHGSKGTANLEPRVRFSQYDEIGHATEVKLENGTVISYIWGYNRTQLIAKIENASNAQIVAALGISFVSINESNLSSNIRTLLPNALVTTYTYIPLLGISTITDPKNYTSTYEYDSFGRLKDVRDAEGNILSENIYHYRN